MEILEQTKTTEIQAIANDINKGIEAFEMRKAELIELASQAEGLDIESIDDRESIREVARLRKDLKSARVEIQKEGKAMRDPLTGISKFIIEKEKELVAIIEPVEQDLKSKEDWIKAEKERIAEELRRKEEEKINKRINALAELGFKIDYSDLKVMTDEEFDELLNEAQERYQEEQEAKRIEEERRAKIDQRMSDLFMLGMNYSESSKEFKHFYAPNDTISMEAVETLDDKEFDVLFQSAKQSIESEQARQAEEKRMIEQMQAELEKERKKAEEREAKIKAEQEKIEAEKRALEEAKRKAELDKQRQIDMEKAKKEAAEKARKEALAEAKAKEEARLERERKAKERAERKAAMAPDKEKIEAYLSAIDELPVPELKSDEAQKIMDQYLQMIQVMKTDVLGLLESI